MRLKTAAKLCAASAIAGAALTPPVMRATKQQAEQVMRRGARGYIRARDRARNFAESTGRPGEVAAFATVLTVKMAKETGQRWRELLADVEREERQTTVATDEPDPSSTVNDQFGTPSPIHPDIDIR